MKHISHRHLLVNLSLKGNFFDKHPDYKNLVIQYFPNLKELDNQQVNPITRNAYKKGMELRKLLIPLTYKLSKL
jgi:hypothetical protein